MAESQGNLCKMFVTFPVAGRQQTETLWARRVSATTARIGSIPFFAADVGYGDLVRAGINGEVVEVLERATRTRCSRYEAEADHEAATRQWQKIRDYLGRLKIECESAIAGVFSMAVPLDVSDEALEDLLSRCPVQLTPPREPTEEQFRLWLQRYTGEAERA